MIKRGILFLAVLGLVAPALVGPVAAQDEWPDQCADAENVSSGTYTGQLTPDDVDILVLEKESGASSHLQFNISGAKLTFTVINKRVTESLYDAGSVDEFRKAVNKPSGDFGDNSPRHITNLDYSLSGGFSYWGDSKRRPYHWMGDGNTNFHLLAYNPAEHAVEGTPFWGPIWTGGPGVVSTAMYFEVDDPLCLRLQTTNDQAAGSWELTIRNEAPTTTSTANSSSDNSAGQDDAPRTTTDDGTGDEVQDSDGDGVIDSEDYAPRDPQVQERSDLVTEASQPGFGPLVALLAVLIAAYVISLRE